jgi:hypothetical protein
VGFLWGSAAVSLSCGVSVGLAEAPDWAGRPGPGYTSPAGFRILMITSRLTQCHRSDLPAYGSSAPNADSALNGIVLLGEGGRVQIAVLCSALGVGCLALRTGLSGTEDGPVGLAGCGPRQRRPPFGDRSTTDSKAVTTGGCPPGAAITRAVLFDGAGRTKRCPLGIAAPESPSNSSRSPAWAAR